MRITGVVSEELLVEQMKEVTLLHDNIVKPYESAEVDIREIDLI